jgi:hypothetical protein
VAVQSGGGLRDRPVIRDRWRLHGTLNRPKRRAHAHVDSRMKWSQNDLRKIAISDDLRISPFRSDGRTYGTPTWIWSVVVDDSLYAPAYNGRQFRWYQAAVAQKAGRIAAAGMTKDVLFELVRESINDRIDDAYRSKYRSSPYLEAMIGERARSATVEILPRLDSASEGD